MKQIITNQLTSKNNKFKQVTLRTLIFSAMLLPNVLQTAVASEQLKPNLDVLTQFPITGSVSDQCSFLINFNGYFLQKTINGETAESIRAYINSYAVDDVDMNKNTVAREFMVTSSKLSSPKLEETLQAFKAMEEAGTLPKKELIQEFNAKKTDMINQCINKYSQQ